MKKSSSVHNQLYSKVASSFVRLFKLNYKILKENTLGFHIELNVADRAYKSFALSQPNPTFVKALTPTDKPA